MYIIDPFYIYIIEQLCSIKGIFLLFSIISVIGMGIHIFIRGDNSDNKYKILDVGIDYHLKGLNSNLNSLNESLQDLRKDLDLEPDVESKNKVASSFINSLSHKIASINNTHKSLEKGLEDYRNTIYIKFPNMKTWVCIFLICIFGLAFIPNKDSAYKILLSSMITVERVTEAGQITTEVANDIVDKITESIIKIQEAKR